MVRWQLAKRRAGDHKTHGRADINRTGKKMYKQKGTGGARHGSARVPQFRGGGRRWARSSRSHEHDLPKKVRALALRHALSAKAARRRADRLGDAPRSPRPRPRRCASFAKAALNNALIIDGAAVDANFAAAARNMPQIDVLPVQGQRLRHPAPREAGADQGRGRSAGGAVQMSKDARHYDMIVAPVITEKATIASEHNQFVFKVAPRRDQAADQGGGREAVQRQGEGGQHARAQGQDQGVPRHPRPAAGRQEGDRDAGRRPPIDVTTRRVRIRRPWL